MPAGDTTMRWGGHLRSRGQAGEGKASGHTCTLKTCGERGTVTKVSQGQMGHRRAVPQAVSGLSKRGARCQRRGEAT